MLRRAGTLLALVLCFSLTCTATGRAFAQEVPQFPAPEPAHEWLQKFVGEWTTESKGTMGPGQAPMECTGRLSSRMLGGFWVVNEMTGDVMGVPMMGVQTIGYDPVKSKYVGTWVDSMTTQLWQYEGEVDSTGTILTLEATGPNLMDEGKTATYRDVYEFKSDDEIAIASRMLADDGTWITFMTGTARRTR